jgi:hypothetical protein
MIRERIMFKKAKIRYCMRFLSKKLVKRTHYSLRLENKNCTL